MKGKVLEKFLDYSTDKANIVYDQLLNLNKLNKIFKLFYKSFKNIFFEFLDTYVSRVKRAHPLIHDEEILDVGQIEKKLVAELGNNVCIYERICIKYAERTLQRRSWERVLNWNEIFRYDISDCNIVIVIIYQIVIISIKIYNVLRICICDKYRRKLELIFEKKLKMFIFDKFRTKEHIIVTLS